MEPNILLEPKWDRDRWDNPRRPRPVGRDVKAKARNRRNNRVARLSRRVNRRARR